MIEAGLDAGGAGFDGYSVTPERIDGGPTDGWTTIEATITVDCRILPGGSAGAVRAAETSYPDGRVEWGQPAPPVVADERSRLASDIRASKREAGGVQGLLHKTGTADMNLFADAWEVPVASYGSGDSTRDHTPDEHLSLAALYRAVCVLESTAIRLGSGDNT